MSLPYTVLIFAFWRLFTLSCSVLESFGFCKFFFVRVSDSVDDVTLGGNGFRMV